MYFDNIFDEKNESLLFKIILSLIWIGATVLAIPQAVAFSVRIMDGSLPQCLPVNLNITIFIW